MIQSVQKAMRILTILSDNKNGPLPLREIALRAGYPKPTCAHLLDALCTDGYAMRISHEAGYTLGPAVYNLTRYGRYEDEFITLCRPVMRWMERKTHATVILSEIRAGQKFIIDYLDNEQNLLREHPYIRTDDIYRTATGRAILAHMPRDEVRTIYEKYGSPPPNHWNEVNSWETLIAQLAILREQKIITAGRSSVGYACPLLQRTVCIGAIGLAWKCSSGETHPDEETEEMLKSILLRGTKEIHRRLMYTE